VATLFTNRIRFVVLPNSQLIAERADSSEPDVAGRALDACFYDSGLEPSPDETALIVSSLWSQFAGLQLEAPPADALAAVPDGIRALVPIGLDSYAGPIIEEVDGRSMLRFLAVDKSQDGWFYDALLLPGEVQTERIWIHKS